MATSSSKLTDSAAKLFDSERAFSNFLSGMQSAFGAPQAGALQTAEKFAEEAFRFWAKRMSAYADHLAALQKCDGPAEMADLGSQFINQSLADYAEETGQFVKLGQDAMNAEAKKVKTAAERTKPTA